MREEFAFYFSTIDLESTQAENLRSNYQRNQEQQNRRQKPILDPSPKERVLLFLEQLESGNLLAWWQINMEMLLKPDSQFYEQELESDLTKLPGWQEADRKTRERIINGAKKYIQEYNQVAYDWIGTNAYDRPALAGCKALQLLLQETPEFLDTIPSEIWQRWASVIVAFPHSSTTQREHYYTELVKRAYINASSETLNTLLSIINKENEEHGYIFILNKFEKYWDEPFKAVLLEKAKDATIKPECIGQLLEELLKRESIGAREFAKSLVSIPLPLEEEAHQKAVVAGRVLVECTEPTSWAVIWSAIHQNTNFGREVFEAVAYRYSHGLHLKLTEKQLADLYIWLVCQYPHAEDPDYSNDVLAHNMGARESVANLRDSVLTQLRETGTSQACIEIERISEQFPKLTWLKRTLLNAQNVTRRKTWKSLKPEQILQIVTNKLKNQSTQIQAGVFIMQGSNNPNLNFSGSVGAVNLNSTVNGDQIGTQHNYAQEQNLAEAFEEIQQIVNRITQNYPTQTEAEKQIIIAEAVEQVKQNPTLRKRLELGGKAFIFEALQKASDQWWVAPFVKAIEAGVKGE